MVVKAWTDWPLVLDADVQSGTPVYVNGRTVLNMGPSVGLAGADGSIYNSFGYLQSQEPTATHTTNDLKEFLDVCGVLGMKIANTSEPGVVVYFQQYALGGTRQTGANQWSCTIGDGIMVPGVLTLPHRGIGGLTANITAISGDGTTHPLTYLETATLPVVNPAVDAAFTLGKIDLNGTSLTGATSVSINFGIQVNVEAADSDIYSTIVYITRIQPSITISGKHIDFTATVVEAGLEFAASQLIVYGRKRDDGGTFVIDGTAEHLKFTLGKCRIMADNIGGQPSANISYTITPWDSPGGVAPLGINTASAIT